MAPLAYLLWGANSSHSNGKLGHARTNSSCWSQSETNTTTSGTKHGFINMVENKNGCQLCELCAVSSLCARLCVSIHSHWNRLISINTVNWKQLSKALFTFVFFSISIALCWLTVFWLAKLWDHLSVIIVLTTMCGWVREGPRQR